MTDLPGMLESEQRRELRIEAFRAWVDEICKNNRLDYTGVARKSGLSPSTITRPLNTSKYAGDIGKRTIAAIANVFTEKPPRELRGIDVTAHKLILHDRQIGRVKTAMPDNLKTPQDEDWEIDKGSVIPIYGRRMLGVGPLLMTGRVGITPTPAELFRSLDAFAVYCSGQPMAPAIKEGSLLYVDPTLPIRAKDFVVVLNPDSEILVREFVGESREAVILFSYEGPETSIHLTMRRDDIAWMYRVVFIKPP